MDRFTEFRLEMRPGVLSWGLGFAAFLIVVLAAIFAVGILLFVVPIVMAAVAIQMLIWRWRFRRMARQWAKENPVIEGDYRVLEPEHDPRPRDRRLT